MVSLTLVPGGAPLSPRRGNMRLNLIGIGLFLGLISLPLYAQDPSEPLDPNSLITIPSQIHPLPARPREQVRLTLQVKLEGEWSIYSLTTPKGPGSRPTRIRLEEHPLEPMNSWLSSRAGHVFSGFSGSFRAIPSSSDPQRRNFLSDLQ